MRILFILLLMAGISSCSKLVEVNPPSTSLTGLNVYSSDATAIAVVTGIYAQLGNQGNIASGLKSISLFCGLSADELTLYSGVSSFSYIDYYKNSLSVSLSTGSDVWAAAYPLIYMCNSVIRGLGASNSLTPSVKTELLGEALFLRAFFYFYLTNLYGDVPLVLTTDYKTNAQLSRTPRAQVYQQMITDLTTAQNLLSTSYLDGTLLATSPERLRPNKWAATALLARVYLYMQKWSDAESQADLIINDSSMFRLSKIDTAFLRAGLGNNEAIWQLQSAVSAVVTNTFDAFIFVIPSSGLNSVSHPVYLSQGLVQNFDSADLRRTHWVDSVVVKGVKYYFPYKYKVSAIKTPVSEYSMVMRLGEIYLIRAEARAQQGNIAGAQGDLDAIRARAGVSKTTVSDQTGLLAVIAQERRLELFTEWGHRWLDLKRTQAVDSVMSLVTPNKGGTWNPDWQLFPLPLTDLQSDNKLTQNPGYN